MRKICPGFAVAFLLLLAGCGTLESWEDRAVWYGGSKPDPTQAEWHRTLFGTRRVTERPGVHQTRCEFPSE